MLKIIYQTGSECVVMKFHKMCVAVAATATLGILVGCADRPSKISASFISHEKYMDLSCSELTNKMSNARAELAKFTDMQNTKANTDAATVFLVLVPLTSMTGDHAGDVARWKGEVEAIDTAQIKLKC